MQRLIAWTSPGFVDIQSVNNEGPGERNEIEIIPKKPEGDIGNDLFAANWDARKGVDQEKVADAILGP